MWKFSVFVFRGRNPVVDDQTLDPADGFLFGNAGIGHAIQMAFQKLLFLLRAELAVVWKTLVFGARDQIEEVLLQIRAGAGDGMDFVLTNHLRQRNTE